MIKVIVFDFDGVLVDSNKLKRNAFYGLLSDVDGVSKKFIDDTWDEMGGQMSTRFDFLKAIFIKLKNNPKEVADLVGIYAGRYEEIIQKGLKLSGLISGTAEALGELGKKYVLYVNSATPEFALKRTINELGITKFFKGILGPLLGLESVANSKKINLEKIMLAENVSGDETLYIGDGEVDRSAAEAYRCRFIGVANDYNNWHKWKDFKTIDSVAELPGILYKNEY